MVASSVNGLQDDVYVKMRQVPLFLDFIFPFRMSIVHLGTSRR